MPTCQKCGKDWSWQQTFKKMFTLNTAIDCPQCGQKQYYSKKARKKTVVVSFLSLFLIFLRLFNISAYQIIGIYLAYFIIVMVLLPFLMELSNEEEALWK